MVTERILLIVSPCVLLSDTEWCQQSVFQISEKYWSGIIPVLKKIMISYFLPMSGDHGHIYGDI